MSPAQAELHFGSKTKAAAAIGVSEQTFRNWSDKEAIPLLAQNAIAHITNNKLKVDRKPKK